jgi:alpha-glucosidase
MFGAVDPSELARPGVLERYWQTGPTLFADYGGPLLAVTLLSADMIRVRLAPGGIFAPRRSWAMARPDEAYAPSAVTIEEDSEHITLLSGHLAVLLTREGGRIRIEERERTGHPGRWTSRWASVGQQRWQRRLDKAHAAG